MKSDVGLDVPAETRVRTDPTASRGEEHISTTGVLAYSARERAAIDLANDAFAPIIESIGVLEDIERWVPPVVEGVRALRARAMRETGALTYLDHQYRIKFGALLNVEPIGPWLLDECRHSLLDAIHYLGRDDTSLDTFMKWWRTTVDDEQRRKWRKLRTLVDHFKRSRHGDVRKLDRRTIDQKESEAVRTEGHKADVAARVEVEQLRREVATRSIENSETLWSIMQNAGPEVLVGSLRDNDARDFARSLYGCLGQWLKEVAKRELIAKHRPAGSMPPNMFRFPKVLTEAEVVEAEEALKALQRRAFAIVGPEEQS
jgi:hypothetical protein